MKEQPPVVIGAIRRLLYIGDFNTRVAHSYNRYDLFENGMFFLVVHVE